jgi:predicted amidohydrolase
VLVKIAAIQARLGVPLALEEKILVFKQRPDFVCLPEYYLMSASDPDYHRAALKIRENLTALTRLSSDLSTCLIGGTVVEPVEDRLFNASFVINRGNVLGGYRKRYPVTGEVEKGISGGSEMAVFDIERVRVGILICGDVFYPENFIELARRDVDIIFIPTTSPFREDDRSHDKEARDRQYFTEGASLAGAFVVKTCGVGSIFGKPLQGRSLIAAPWGIIRRVDFTGEQQEQIICETVDVEEIREFRRKRRARKRANLLARNSG